jgi:hypothetical protein
VGRARRLFTCVFRDVDNPPPNYLVVQVSHSTTSFFVSAKAALNQGWCRRLNSLRFASAESPVGTTTVMREPLHAGRLSPLFAPLIESRAALSTVELAPLQWRQDAEAIRRSQPRRRAFTRDREGQAQDSRS